VQSINRASAIWPARRDTEVVEHARSVAKTLQAKFHDVMAQLHANEQALQMQKDLLVSCEKIAEDGRLNSG
jgi:hypothetical protein